MPTYEWDDWTFNTKLWAEAIAKGIDDVGISALADLSGVSQNTLRNWARGTFTEGFTWPHMVNFFKIVNLLDLDPRLFFVLEDKS